jgi:hypothetical protein
MFGAFSCRKHGQALVHLLVSSVADYYFWSGLARDRRESLPALSIKKKFE